MIFGRSVPQRVCLVHDISDGGARLHIGLLLDPPEQFELSLRPDSEFHRKCRLVWRSEFEIGIKFI